MSIPISLLPHEGDTIKSIQPVLYKYLDFDSAILMLENSNIQFTRSTKLNDPFECYPGLIDFSTDDPELLEAFRKMQRDQYICSLSKVYDSLLMWSYYNDHTGICIGLDFKKIEALLREQHTEWFPFMPSCEVEYRTSFDKFDYSISPEQALRYITFTKAHEWNHECEVRMAIQSPPEKDLDGDYVTAAHWRPHIGGECFKSIYLGAKLDKVEVYNAGRDYMICEKGLFKKGDTHLIDETPNRNKIIELARSLNQSIKIYQMQVNQNAFKLECIEV